MNIKKYINKFEVNEISEMVDGIVCSVLERMLGDVDDMGGEEVVKVRKDVVEYIKGSL